MNKQRIGAAAVLVALLAAGAWWWTQQSGTGRVEYRTAALTRGNLQATVACKLPRVIAAVRYSTRPVPDCWVHHQAPAASRATRTAAAPMRCLFMPRF